MQAGTEIVNMQGTSKDPKHGYNSWIDFMRAAYQKIGLENGLVGGCSVDNYIYERDENGDEIAIPCAHTQQVHMYMKWLADKLTLIIFIWFHCVVVTIRQALYVLI